MDTFPWSELLDGLSDGICVSGPGDRILHLNAAAERLLGISKADAAGQTSCGLICARLSTADSPDCATGCPLRNRDDGTLAVSFVGRRDAKTSYRWREGGPRRESGGAPLRVRCVRVPPPPGASPAEERRFTILEDAAAELELERAREDWRSMVAHDLRAPLTNMLGVLRDLQESAGRPPDPEMLDIGVRNGLRMNAMLDLYLEVAKLEAGRMPVELRRVDLAALAEACAREQAATARERGIAVVVNAAPGLAAAADERLLGRALQNLFNNALKFTPSFGRVEIRASVEGDEAVVAVRDSGPGIAPEDLPRLFDRFRRGRSAGGRPGTGLGLAFCREAVVAMGGEIAVESRPGEGAEFTLRLRRAEG